MNRPIKFRAWSKSLERMIPFEEIEISYHNITLKQAFDSQGDDILMQFTGLLDKNGKEIYESDIVKFDDLPRVIKYSPYYGFVGCFPEGIDIEKCEVIGNIYEHPHLLKSGEGDIMEV